MKKEDKKVPDAPKRLWVRTNSLIHRGRRHKMKKNKAQFLDIMLNDRFVCTLKYMYCPLFAIRYEALIKFVLDKRPTLKGKPFRIMF